jgi:hypothetical protein
MHGSWKKNKVQHGRKRKWKTIYTVLVAPKGREKKRMGKIK